MYILAGGVTEQEHHCHVFSKSVGSYLRKDKRVYYKQPSIFFDCCFFIFRSLPIKRSVTSIVKFTITNKPY